MKKMTFLAVVLILIASPAYALFTNGGFETGDFTGWTLGGTGVGLSTVITAATPMQSGQTLDVNPYNGNYMARINDIFGGYHYTSISQQDTIAAGDLTETLYVNWGAMLIEPINVHPQGDQPYFDIAVLKNGAVLDSFHADALLKQGGGWVNAGYNDGDLWYKSGTYSYALSSFAIGDAVRVEMRVEDCGWGGHGGFAFLDGIGTVYQPPGVIPEPCTMLLFGTGIAGAAGILRKRIKKN